MFQHLFSRTSRFFETWLMTPQQEDGYGPSNEVGSKIFFPHSHQFLAEEHSMYGLPLLQYLVLSCDNLVTSFFFSSWLKKQLDCYGCHQGQRGERQASLECGPSGCHNLTIIIFLWQGGEENGKVWLQRSNCPTAMGWTVPEWRFLNLFHSPCTHLVHKCSTYPYG